MDVVKVTRGHQATVPSRGTAKPAASPTFNLLGHRRAKDGLTWHEHYKKARAKLAQDHQDPGLRPILEQISADPRYRVEGYTQQQLVNWWLAHPQAAASAIDDFSTRAGVPAGRQIAVSVDNPHLPGNAVVNVPSPWTAPVNAAATALMPWQARGLAQNAARFIPDVAAAYLNTAPPEGRNETVRRLGSLFTLQNQRRQLADGSPEAAAVDQQIAAAQSQLKPITGEPETPDDQTRRLLASITGQGLTTAVLRSPIGGAMPVVNALAHSGDILGADSDARRRALGQTLGGAMGAAVAQGWTPQSIQQWAARQPAAVRSVPTAVANQIEKLKALKDRLPWSAAAKTAPAVGSTAAEGAEAVGTASRLARLGTAAGSLGKGLGAILRRAPAVGTALAGGQEAWNLPHNLSPAGQDELVQQMVERDPAREQQSLLGRIGTGAGDALKAMALGNTAPAKTDFALALADATGQVPQEVQNARQGRADYRQQIAMRDELHKGFQKLIPQLPGPATFDLADAAMQRRWNAENGQPIDPQTDEQQMEAWVNEARQGGLLTRDVTPGEMDRFKMIARAAGPEAALETFFPKAYDQRGQWTGDRAAHPHNLDRLAVNASAPEPLPEELQYFNRAAYYKPPALAAPAVASPAASPLALPPVHAPAVAKPAAPAPVAKAPTIPAPTTPAPLALPPVVQPIARPAGT